VMVSLESQLLNNKIISEGNKYENVLQTTTHS